MKTVKLGKTEEESFCDFVAVVARGAGGWRKEWRRNRKLKKGECEAGRSVEGNGQGRRCSGLVSAWIRVGGQRLWMKRMRGSCVWLLGEGAVLAGWFGSGEGKEMGRKGIGSGRVEKKKIQNRWRGWLRFFLG